MLCTVNGRAWLKVLQRTEWERLWKLTLQVVLCHFLRASGYSILSPVSIYLDLLSYGFQLHNGWMWKREEYLSNIHWVSSSGTFHLWMTTCISSKRWLSLSINHEFLCLCWYVEVCGTFGNNMQVFKSKNHISNKILAAQW